MYERWTRFQREGFVEVLGCRLYYKVCSPENPSATALCLHGGPGMPHEYLLPFSDLANFGFRTVFFDFLGVGRSEVPEGISLYTIDHNVEEIEGVRTALELGRVHLIGSSYGGALTLAYGLAHPEGVRSLVTVGGLASVPFTVAEMNRLRATLPPSSQETLARYEAVHDFQNPEYLTAVREFYRRFVCRLDPWPPELDYTLEHTALPVYQTMNGPNEFTIIGTIKDWDITDQLHRIRRPLLVTGGRYDEVSPAVARSIHENVPGSKLVTFEASSHTPFWEERNRFIETVARFLSEVDAAPPKEAVSVRRSKAEE